MYLHIESLICQCPLKTPPVDNELQIIWDDIVKDIEQQCPTPLQGLNKKRILLSALVEFQNSSSPNLDGLLQYLDDINDMPIPHTHKFLAFSNEKKLQDEAIQFKKKKGRIN